MNGPRFNSKTEIRALAAAGVQAISQSRGPEAVLSNELEIPYALAGFVVDYANGVSGIPTPVEVLQENLMRSKAFLRETITALARMENEPVFENLVYRF
ncbi:MAG: hypothetical protein R6V45_11700 [Oceanipulchritudo sp.]